MCCSAWACGAVGLMWWWFWGWFLVILVAVLVLVLVIVILKWPVLVLVGYGEKKTYQGDMLVPSRRKMQIAAKHRQEVWVRIFVLAKARELTR